MSDYLERYGAWAGKPNGYAPDYSRCCAEVYDRFSARQCSNRKSVGDYCRVHDPEAAQARRDASDRKCRASRVREYRAGLGDALALIEAIAAGDNNPRQSCLDWLARNKDRLTYPEGEK